MKKIFLSLFGIILLTGCTNKQENSVNPNIERVSQNIELKIETNNITNTEAPAQSGPINIIISASDGNNTVNNNITEPTENEISSFTTELLTDDKSRENNIDITCGKLNNVIIKPGEIFSFTNTVGQSTTEKGYEKANVFDADGNTFKGLGGGNCQVSSTLYNAVLEANLEVVERHEHSNIVHYVPQGRDAAVAYGSLDFKFKNNTNSDIKIYASSTETNVTVRLVKLANQ